jgi:hypothetical protein
MAHKIKHVSFGGWVRKRWREVALDFPMERFIDIQLMFE